MYEELLELLEKRYKDGEIDKENYDELKERYAQKLDGVKKDFEIHQEASQIYTSGVKVMTNGSLSVAGSTRISGGEVLKDIRIAGSGKIDSDVICNQLKVAGSLKSSGNITARGDVRASGSFKSAGFLRTDKDAKFSGSAKIDEETIVQGRLTVAGSFKCDENVQAVVGVKFAGSSNIAGSLLSQGTVEIEGKTQIAENLVGGDVSINKSKESLFLRRKKLSKSEIGKDVFATGDLYIANTEVNGDVKGLSVELGPYTKVNGIVYYVERLDIDRKVELANEPIKISREKLQL